MRGAIINNLSGSYGDNQPWQHPNIWTTVKKYQLDTIVFDPRDYNVNDTCLTYFRDKGVKVGLNRNPNESHYDAIELADLQSQDINDKGQNGKQCFLLANIEYPYRGSYIVAWLQELQKKRPGRFKYWGVEGNQGGWIKATTGLVPLLNTTAMFKGVCAECYDGWMNPYPPDAIRSNLMQAGIVPAKAMLYPDGKTQTSVLGEVDCIMFTFERLP